MLNGTASACDIWLVDGDHGIGAKVDLFNALASSHAGTMIVADDASLLFPYVRKFWRVHVGIGSIKERGCVSTRIRHGVEKTWCIRTVASWAVGEAADGRPCQVHRAARSVARSATERISRTRTAMRDDRATSRNGEDIPCMHASHPCFQHITFFVRVGRSGVSVGGKAAKRTMPAVLSRDDAQLADLDLEDQSVQHIAGLIRERLTAKLDRVVDVFHKLDVDGSGTIDGFEFSQALRGMGVREPGIGPCVGALFASLDVDGDGFIRYDELRGLLTRSSSSHPDLPPLPPNAANPIALRKERVQSNNANVLQGLDLDEDAMETIPQQIQAALQLNRARVIDVFRQFDDDGDTAVSRKEFRKALRELGLEASKAAMDAVFDEMDLDGSGEIDFDDLRRTLNGEKRSAEAIAAQKRAAKSRRRQGGGGCKSHRS